MDDELDWLKSTVGAIVYDEKLIGTAYLVEVDRMATCAHIVRLIPPDAMLEVYLPEAVMRAKMDKAHPIMDAAILKLEGAAKAAPLRLSHTTPTLNGECRAYGFPEIGTHADAPRPVGRPIVGRIRDAKGKDTRGRSALQVYWDDIAAAEGARPHGLSGSPVLWDRSVVGHLNTIILDSSADPDKPETWRAQLGAIDACPVSAVYELLGRSQQMPAVQPMSVEVEELRRRDPAAVVLCSQLRRISTEHSSEEVEESSAGLPYHDFREVQPSLATLLDDASNTRMALTGRGGIGKTRVLKAVLAHYQEPDVDPIYWTGADLRGVPPGAFDVVLQLIRAEANARGKTALVLVDALEDITDAVSVLRDLVAILARNAQELGLRVILAIRAVTWWQLASSGSAGNRWKHVELSDWPEEVVRSEVNASQRPRITNDLIQLLRTPLMLDLFLRTFGKTQEVPEGLQSRHGMLSAYWARRILPDGDPTSSSRQGVLLHCAQEEASGKRTHAGQDPAYVSLTSEGIFVLVQGTYLFRHALLRDFAMMRWVLDGNGTAQVSSRLLGIISSLVRFGAFRATVEALCDRSPAAAFNIAFGTLRSLDELIRLLSPGQVAVLTIAEILAELEDPSQVDLPALAGALPDPSQAADFVRRIVHVARMSVNRAWLERMSVLPETTEWAEMAPWLSLGVMAEIIGLVEVIGRGAYEGERAEVGTLCRHVSRRLREWSQAPRFREALASEALWTGCQLIRVVCHTDPGNETLEWLEAYAAGPPAMRSAIVESLPALVVRARDAGLAVDEHKVEALFLRSGALGWDAGLIVRDPNSPIDPMWDYHWIQQCLLGVRDGRKGPPGLIRLLPARFLQIAIGLVAGRANEYSKPSPPAQPNETLEAAFQALIEEIRNNRPPQEREIEKQLRSRCHPPQSSEQAVGALISDTRVIVHEIRMQSPDGIIAAALIAWLRDAIEQDERRVLEIYWPVAQASRSMAARAILLDVLVEKERVRLPAIVDALLFDHRIYHDRDIAFYLWKAITARWNSLNAVSKSKVLANIESVARSPVVDGVYAVGPLLSAVPVSDRPAELLPFLSLYEVSGRDPTPSRPGAGARTAEVHPIDTDEMFYRFARPQTFPPECQQKWHAVFQWTHEKLTSTPEALEQALLDLRAVLPDCLPDVKGLHENRWVLAHLEMILTAAANRREKQQTPSSDLSIPELQIIAEWAFRALESVDPNAANADRSPVKANELFPSSKEGVWGDALSLLDEALDHPSMAGNLPQNRRLFDWVEKMMANPSPRAARHLFTHIRANHWLVDEDRGPRLLRTLLTEKVQDGGALRWSLSLLNQFSPAYQHEVFSAWLLGRSEALPQTGVADFAEAIGEYLGRHTMLAGRHPNLGWARQLVEHCLTNWRESGMLTGDEARRHFIKGVTFGAKETVLWGRLGSESAVEFAQLMILAWGALTAAGRRDDATGEFALFAFQWLSVAITKAADDALGDVGLWWSSLEPLAKRIINEGSRKEVFDLIFSLREPAGVRRLGAENLRGIVDALDARIDREPGEAFVERTSDGHDWHMILEYASELLESIAVTSKGDGNLKERIFGILQRWGAPPLGVGRAVRASMNLRRTG